MIQFYRCGIRMVLVGIFCGSLGCATSPTAVKPAPAFSGCCGPQIKGVCMASYYDRKGSLYITQQTHWFCPCQRSLQIRANEPEGEFSWRLHNDTFSVAGPHKNSIPNIPFDKMLSLAVLYSMASSTELLSQPVSLLAEPIKLEGQWYIPITRHIADTTITILKSRDTGRVDLVKIQDNKTALLAQSYNFRFDKTLQKNIPQTIDVFDITNGLSFKKLVLQLQYIQIETQN